jgi:4'-phosphopantetheinyl transferase
MPEVWRKKESNYDIIVWQSTEPIADLLEAAQMSEQDISTFNAFRSETRKREWVTVRAALRKINPLSNPDITYNENGKPFLVDDRPLSISHSGPFVALMTGHTSALGIDIEEIHPRIERLALKFVNAEESIFIDQINRQHKLHVLWGAKEVLFKIYSKGNVDFRKDLCVSKFDLAESGYCFASIKKNDFERNLIVYYHQLDNYMLAYCVDQDFEI